MKQTMRVKPVEGRIVRDPVRGDDLPIEGRQVPRNVYWWRCVQAGDVIETDEPSHEREAPGSADTDGAASVPSGTGQTKVTKGGKG